MGALGNLVPLVILFLFVGGVAWVGYQVCFLMIHAIYKPVVLTGIDGQIYLWSNQLAARGVHKMEKKNVVFTKDGMKVGVKEVRPEEYQDKTQRYVASRILRHGL